MIVIFWRAPNVLRNQFEGIKIVHAASVGHRAVPIRVALRPPAVAKNAAQHRTTIPPVPSRNARRIVIDEAAAAAVAEASIPDDLKGSFEGGPAAEFSEQVLKTRLKDLPRMSLEPEVIDAPMAPKEERNLEPANPSPLPKGGNVKQARLLKQVLPIYPSLARTARVQGTVVLEATIGKSGAVEDVTVVDGHPMLIGAAVEAVRQWQYEPAKLNEVPTRSSVRITVVFKLEFQR